MTTQSMPTCEALAADPERYMFKSILDLLRKSTTYEAQHLLVIRLHGHLSGLLEAEAISANTWEAATNESHEFVWGPRS